MTVHHNYSVSMCMVGAVLQVVLQAVYCGELIVREETNLIVNEFELPSHLFVDIVELVHRTDLPVHAIKVF